MVYIGSVNLSLKAQLLEVIVLKYLSVYLTAELHLPNSAPPAKTVILGTLPCPSSGVVPRITQSAQAPVYGRFRYVYLCSSDQ